jgi:hypothetical protein
MVGLRWRETPRDRAPLRRFLCLADHQFRARQDASDGFKVASIPQSSPEKFEKYAI